MRYPDLLKTYKRIAICGGSRTGKTTLAMSVPHELLVHTDQYMSLPWDKVPLVILERLAGVPSFVLEGVQAARTLRKGLEVDCVIWLDRPYERLDPKQQAFAKSIRTVFDDWRSANWNVPVFHPDRTGDFTAWRG